LSLICCWRNTFTTDTLRSCPARPPPPPPPHHKKINCSVHTVRFDLRSPDYKTAPLTTGPLQLWYIWRVRESKSSALWLTLSPVLHCCRKFILLLFISPLRPGPTLIGFFFNGHTKYIQITNYDKTLEMCGTSSIRWGETFIKNFLSINISEIYIIQ